MISTNPTAVLSASVTLLIVVFYMATVYRVAILRLKLAIKAPVFAGPPVFERACRVQMNTLEQMGILLPLLWIATLNQAPGGYAAPILSFIWLIGRVIYQRGYMANPDSVVRGIGWALGGVCNLGLLILAVWGVAVEWVGP